MGPVIKYLPTNTKLCLLIPLSHQPPWKRAFIIPNLLSEETGSERASQLPRVTQHSQGAGL